MPLSSKCKRSREATHEGLLKMTGGRRPCFSGLFAGEAAARRSLERGGGRCPLQDKPQKTPGREPWKPKKPPSKEDPTNRAQPLLTPTVRSMPIRALRMSRSINRHGRLIKSLLCSFVGIHSRLACAVSHFCWSEDRCRSDMLSDISRPFEYTVIFRGI